MEQPGVLALDVTLDGGDLDPYAAVGFDQTRREFIALNPSGFVDRWAESGVHLGSVQLKEYGAINGEDGAPQNTQVAWGCDHYLTYSGGYLSAWDTTTGERISTTLLSRAGTSSDSHQSMSFSNDRAYVIDKNGGLWNGYPVFKQYGYSASFTGGATADQADKDAWGVFSEGLATLINAGASFKKVTLRGSEDPVGITCTDPTVADSIADAVASRGRLNIPCGNDTWDMNTSGAWFGVAALGTYSSCPNPGYILRPDITNANWGGINGATCFAESQTIEIIFSY
jgi:hypothetical protein